MMYATNGQLEANQFLQSTSLKKYIMSNANGVLILRTAIKAICLLVFLSQKS